jgi:phosphotriesterase-related protein
MQEQLKPTMLPNWSMTFLFEQVIPELTERGMTAEQLDRMMVENPRLWLA